MSAEPVEEARALGEVQQAMRDFFTARATRKDSPNTREAYQRDLRQVLGEVARHLDVAPSDVTFADIRQLTVLRRAFAAYAEPRSAGTVRRCLSTWSEFFKFLVSEELVDGSPMPAIPRPAAPKRVPRAFSKEDEDRILTTVLDGLVSRRDPWPELDLAVMNTLFATAVRTGELLGADIEDVTYTPGDERLRVRGKGGKERVVPLERVDVEFLEEYLESRRARFPDSVRKHSVREDARIWEWFPPKTPLFVDRKGARMQRNALQYLVRLVYRAAGVESKRAWGALVHATRHTTATRLSEDGVNVNDLKEILGHATLQTVQIYVSSTGAALRAALARNTTYRLHATRAAADAADPPAEE